MAFSQEYYCHSGEIKDLVLLCLNKNIKMSKVHWERKQCSKCGIIGDPRFVSHFKCHTISKTSHKIGFKCEFNHLPYINNNINYTSNSRIIKIHCGDKCRKHTNVAKTRYHSGKLVRMHVQDWEFKTAAKVGFAIGGVAGFFIGVSVAGVAMSAIEKFNDVIIPEETVDGILAAGGCSGGVGGVATAAMYGSYWPCCNQDGDSEGCQLRYQCCKHGKESQGCYLHSNENIKYPCCDGKYQSEGCFEYYSCCPDIDANDPNGGCIDKCSQCNKTVEGQNGESCGCKWTCCNASGPIRKMNDKLLHCQVLCKACDKQWGDSKYPGCTESKYAQHEMVIECPM